jgi:hypothetical protein
MRKLFAVACLLVSLLLIPSVSLAANHRYWRVIISGQNGANNGVAINSLQFYDGSGIRLDGSGTGAASSTFSGLPASQAFDSNDATQWGTASTPTVGSPQWLSYDFGSGQSPGVAFFILSVGGGGSADSGQAPMNFKLQSSDDNSLWTDATSAFSPSWSASQGAYTFPVAAPATGNYTNWRANYTNTTSGNASAAQVVFAVTAGGAQAATGGFYFSSGCFTGCTSSGFKTANAFDNNAATFWGSSTLNSIGYAFTKALAISEVVITAPTGSNVNDSPNAFNLQGSNDGVTWTTVQAFTASGWTPSQIKTFDVPGSGTGTDPVSGTGTGTSACAGVCLPVQAVLTWSSAGSGLTYNIYESSTSNGVYAKIASGITGLTYTDGVTVMPGASNFYQISATDGSGNEGAKTAATVATVPSTDDIAVTMPTPSAPTITAGGLTITGIAATVTQNTATITWTTNVAADSQVGYSIVPSTSLKFSPCCNPSNTTTHSVTLPNLAPGTTYNYVVDSTMTAAPNKEVQSPILQFTTAAATNLTISNVAVGSIGMTTATVTWQTNVGGSTRVGYAAFPSTAYTFTTLDSTLITSHTANISGLTAGTKYNFIAESTGGNPSSTIDSAIGTFTTAAPSPVNITAVAASSIKSTGATITWATDQASDSEVLFAISPSVSFQATSVTDGGGVTTHTVVLGGLQPSTTYNYEVKSTSIANPTVVATSVVQQFATSAAAVIVSNVAATNVTATGATITWMTNSLANSQVGYAVSPSTNYTQTVLNASQVASHSVALTGLNPNTTYIFVAESNSTQSPSQTFTTLNNAGTFTVSNITVTAITSSGATVNWTTSSAADSQVGYALPPSTVYKFSTCCEPSNVTSHSVTLTGLSPGTVYNFVVDSTMTAAPRTEFISPKQQFTTTGTGGTTPPALGISGVNVSNAGQTSATFIWNTNNPADSNVGVAVSPSTSYSFGSVVVTKVTGHNFTVSGLTAGTTYNYVVRSNDGTTTVTSPNSSFTTTAIVSGGGGGGVPGVDCSISQSGCTGPAGPVHAFPTAEGGGAASVGGRGGIVMEVTNLNDTGAGSLRACMTADVPRNCIFRTAGLITNKSRLQTGNHPFLTIAGQTAPGNIVVGGKGQSGEAIQVNTHDVQVRYLTWDGNAGCNNATFNGHTECVYTTGPSSGSVGLETSGCFGSCFNVIWDHTTMRRAGNKGWLILSNPGTVHDVTYQWGIAEEPNVGHPVITEPDAFSGGSVVASINNDYIKNFVTNFDHRWILYDTGTSIMQNNISYNGTQFSDSFNVSIWGGLFLDLLGNKFVDGPQSANSQWTVIYQTDPNASNDSADCAPCDHTRPAKFHFRGNIAHPGKANRSTSPIAHTEVANDSGQQSLCQIVSKAEGGNGPLGSCSSVFVSSPTQIRTWQPIYINPDVLDDTLMPTVGNSQRLDCNGNFVNNRDAEEVRVVAQYKSRGPGTMFAGRTDEPNPDVTATGINYTGNLNAPALMTGAVCQESLHDGIPDQWKSKYGFSLSDSTLYQRKAPNGYTYLENYLNGTNPNK